ncbi:hypothetical protein ACFLQN_00400 [Candidatus Aenigmatarchaeota archaeon]
MSDRMNIKLRRRELHRTSPSMSIPFSDHPEIEPEYQRQTVTVVRRGRNLYVGKNRLRGKTEIYALSFFQEDL